MQYRKMNEAELKAYYNTCGHRYYVNVEGSGMCVRDCRSERNVLGRSNLIFHLPMAGVLLDKKGKDYDVITKMFPSQALARLIWTGFSDDVCVLLGSEVLGDAKKSFKSHFDVTFEPKKARYIYIRDLNVAPSALAYQAVHIHMGDPNASAIVGRYNHYVFPLGLSYNNWDLEVAQSYYQQYLKKRFGDLPLVECQNSGVTPEKGYTARRYEDDLSCQRSFVIEASGRLLKPLRNTDKVDFVGATMVATETWEEVAPDAIIANYRSDCFSLPAEYSFGQRPEKFSPAQKDRLMMLAKKLQSQRQDKARIAGLSDFLDKSTDENAWR